MNAVPGILRTGFKPSSYTNYAEEMERITSHIYHTIHRADKLREIDVELWGKSLKNDHRFLAQCCVLTDEIPSARTFYHNVVRIDLALMDMVRNNTFPKLPKTGRPHPFHCKFSDGFPEAILAGDELLLLEFAKSLSPGEQPQSDNKFAWHVTNAIKLHILGDNVSAKREIAQAHKLEYFRLSWKGYSHAVLGIIERDAFLVNEGIELRIRAHKTKEFKTIYFEYSEEATALAKLAIRAGLRPNVQSSFISKKLLTGNERSMDNSVEELLGALNEANSRKGDLFWRLKKFFR